MHKEIAKQFDTMKLDVDRMMSVEMVINVFRDHVLMLARLIDAVSMLNAYRRIIVDCVLARQATQETPILNVLQVSRNDRENLKNS